LLDCFD